MAFPLSLYLKTQVHIQFTKSILTSCQKSICNITSPQFPPVKVFNQNVISSLNIKPLKYLGSNISSTESNVNVHISEAWTAIDRLTTIWKSDLSDKIKQEFLQAIAVLVLLYCCTTLTKHMENLRWELHKNAACSFEHILQAALYKTPVVQPFTAHKPSKINKTC